MSSNKSNQKEYKLNSTRGLDKKIKLFQDFLSSDTFFINEQGVKQPFSGKISKGDGEYTLLTITPLFGLQSYPIYKDSSYTIDDDTLVIKTTYKQDDTSIKRTYTFEHSETTILLKDWEEQIKRFALYSIYEKTDIAENKKEEKTSDSSKNTNTEVFTEDTADELQKAFSTNKIKQAKGYDVNVPDFSCVLAPTSNTDVVIPYKENQEALSSMLYTMEYDEISREAKVLINEFYKKFVNEAILIGCNEKEEKSVHTTISDSSKHYDINKFTFISLSNQSNNLTLLDSNYNIRADIRFDETGTSLSVVIVDKKTSQVFTPKEFSEEFLTRYMQHIQETKEIEKLNKQCEELEDVGIVHDDELLHLMIISLAAFFIGVLFI